jgi:hypothetical protein
MVKPPSPDTLRITATVDRELHDRLAAYCADRKLSISQGTSRAIEAFLDVVQADAQPAPYRRRISSS